MNSRISLLAAISQVFRFEYIAATLPGMTITYFLCARSARELLSIAVVEALAITALMLFAGLGINAIVDRDIDGKYATYKSKIPNAIDIIGVRRTWLLIVAQSVLAGLLAIHIALQFQSVWPILAFLGVAFFGLGYSAPPLKFKVRGLFLHALSLSLSSCFIPFALSAYTYLGKLPASLLLFIAGFGLVQYGFEYSNQAMDYLEDKQEGLQTPAVRLGVVGSMRASLLVPTIGMCIAFAGLYGWVQERAPGASTATVFTIWALAVCAMLAGYFIPMRNTWRMYRLSRAQPEESCVPQFPSLCRYAQWQASSVAGVAAASALVFIATT